ncbi:MAG TPA: serine/threonine-protein kinase [Candidatus Nanoarchaeia archaeon]|nr:serine/threonine-protein kinase [Candidatus Nanoarchaeia archaeon]
MSVESVERIGAYELRKRVAETSFSEVFEARDGNRTVALKRAKEGHEHDIKEEAEILSSLRHPNIVQFIASCVDERTAYLVTELYPKSLREIINEQALLLQEYAVKLSHGILSGLAYVHEQGIAHRDLKPENILLNGQGEPVICDFGTAAANAVHNTLNTNANGEGTTEYRAPEQQRGKGGPPADLYAFGFILYEMLTGKRPTPQFTPASNTAGSSPRLDDLIAQCIKNNPQERPTAQHALAILNSLGQPAENDVAILLVENQELRRQKTYFFKQLFGRRTISIAAGALIGIVTLAYGIGYITGLRAREDAELVALYANELSNDQDWYEIRPGTNNNTDTLYFPIGLDPSAGPTLAIPIDKSAARLLRNVIDAAQARDRLRHCLVNEEGKQCVTYGYMHMAEILRAFGAPERITDKQVGKAHEIVMKNDGGFDALIKLR